MTITKSKKERVSKLNAWLRAYLDENNPVTFLNKFTSAKAAKYKCKDDDSFAQIGCRNFKKVNDKIEKWFDEVGLSENALKNKLLSLMEAKETKFFAHEGTVTDQRDVDALGIQAKILDMAIKVRGMYAAEKYDHTGTIQLAPAKIDKTKGAGK
jgi:hypothetical protein